MKNNIRLWFSLIVVIALCNFAAAQTSLGSSKTFMNNLKKQLAKNEKTVLLQVKNSKTFKAKINYRESNSSSEFLNGEIKNVPEASFYIKVSDKSLEGHIIFKKTKEAYKYYSDAHGNAYIKKEDINKLICLDYKTSPKNASESTSKVAAQISPAMLNMQSLPGAPGCVLLDFDGYYMPAGSGWNNGNPILAAPSGMSDAAVLQFWEVVSEDYRPFNLNITTSEEVFNSYPKTRRMRAVVTPTDIVAPSAGGVAYVGSFNWDNDFPCWVFDLTGKSGGDIASHEIGHTFDLHHDGRTTPPEGYYYGIGGSAWAPIMGIGNVKPVVQWSKGEYDNANNTQDDVETIASPRFGVGYRADDYGNDITSAAKLEYNTKGTIDQKNGVITSATDYDFFTFTTSGGNVSISANTVARDGNLHLKIKLYSSDGAEMDTYWNPDPFVLNAYMTVNLPAGKYFISINGSGAGIVSDGGYSSYASLGSYSITGAISPGGNISPSTDVVTVYRDCDYRGFSGGLTIGDYNLARLNSLGILDNDISSLRVPQGFKAILYQDDNFTGPSTVIDSDNSCLDAIWINKATSVRVMSNGVTNLGDTTYFLRNRNSNLDMSVWGGSIANGANIAQWTPESGTNQKYTFTHLGDGLYKIIANNSRMSINVFDSNQANGANVEQYDYTGAANQQFIVVTAEDGFYKIIARHSGKLVEVAEGSKVKGGNVQQWENNNQIWGQWKLVPTTGIINPTTDVVTVYNDCNYIGFSGGLTIGDYNLARLNSLGVLNDIISSIRVAQGFKAVLYQNDNFTGASTVLSSDNNCLDAAWDNKISSVRILANGVTNLGNTTYNLQNRNSGLNMDVLDGSTADGANIAQQTPESTENQKYTFTHLGDGLYKIISNKSDKSINIFDSSKANGANVDQFSYHEQANQQFIVVAAGGGFYKIIARHSGKVIDVAGGSTANGANVQQWENNDQTWGQWKLIPTEGIIYPSTDVVTVYNDCNYTGFSGGLTIGDYNLARLNSLGILDDNISSIHIAQGFKAILYQDDNFTGASTVIDSDNNCLDAAWDNKVTSVRVLANGVTNLGDVTYFLRNRNSNLDMSVWKGSIANGANIAQWTPESGTNQKYTFTHLGDGLYKIIANNSRKSINVFDSDQANGANVEQYDYTGTANQQFIIVATGDGFYKIIARHSGKVIDVAGGSKANGANVQQWENIDQIWGQWSLIPTTPSQTSTLIEAEHYSAMYGILTETTTDTDGGLNVGYTDKDDWMRYNNINFPTSGSYLIEYRVASAVNGAKISSDLNEGTTSFGKVKIPNTGGWQKWQTVSQTVNVDAGTYNFGINIEKSGVNINWIRITKSGNPTTSSAIANEETDADFLNIYPNPVENTLFITNDLAGGNISIVDSQTGTIVLTPKANNNSIDVSQLRRGVYLIVFEKDGTKTIKRFIKK